MDYTIVSRCRICNSIDIIPYLNLGFTPLANSLSQDAQKYPLEVLYCLKCSLSQLSIVVDPKTLYEDYPYHSSVSQTFRNHCYDLAIELKKFEFEHKYNPIYIVSEERQLEESKFRRVIDIASNDNCLLKEFVRSGNYLPFGVEPAKNFDYKEPIDRVEDLIPMANVFWSSTCLDQTDIAGRAHFITATNVFAHVDDLRDFLLGVRKYLRDDGVFVVEVPHLVSLINGNQFDTIYHEHLSCFLLKPLIQMFKESGLPIFRVTKQSIHGGSLRIFAGNRPEESSVNEILVEEDSGGFYNFETYRKYARQVGDVKFFLSNLLKSLKQDSKKVMCYGASAKGSTLLNYCEIGKDLIHSAVDETPDKQGKSIAGIPIVPFDHFEKEKPDYILLTAWNFKEELMSKTKHLGAKYIVPIPRVEIL